ncbi:hypothetical protein Dace_0456 [Desulfuromonas acetoxidans DSM 684]|uniref:Uncharacterized protein n=2 Tax=Desulfuromonas acetoxidans TaxID=891 RepID=Q1JW40_DESA6|nr:hypothetical protein Dace_0456 [Desulfuromonas acetoxidans DSM 684]
MEFFLIICGLFFLGLTVMTYLVRRNRMHPLRHVGDQVTMEEAQKILQAIENHGPPELIQTVLQAAIDYARLRVDWQQSEHSQKIDLGKKCTASLDSFINRCTILCEWITEHGSKSLCPVPMKNDKQKMSKLACLLHAQLGLKNN